jgi:hypothetical protein
MVGVQALAWERVRILAVKNKVSVCGCGQAWSEHGNMNAQPRCWQLLDSDESLNKIIRQPLYIFYDDHNVCFVDHRLNCLYVDRAALIWGVDEEEKPEPEQQQPEKVLKSSNKKKQAKSKPERSWSTETVWSGDINAPFTTAGEARVDASPHLPDLVTDYTPHWDPNDWLLP